MASELIYPETRPSWLGRFNIAVETVSEAVGLYDGDDHLVAFNQRYASLRATIGGKVAVGVAWHDLVTASIRNGKVCEAIGHEDQWLEQRRQSRGHYSAPRQIPDGTAFQVNETCTRTGGIIEIWSEITLLGRHDAAWYSPALEQALADIIGLSSYDPCHLMAEANRCRKFADIAPVAQREFFLERAEKFEMMVRRSLTLPSVTEPHPPETEVFARAPPAGLNRAARAA